MDSVDQEVLSRAVSWLDTGLGVCLATVVRTYGSSPRPVGALLAAQAGIEVSVCPNADQGIGASLAWGVKAGSEADGWVIPLGDMPFIAAQTHRRVAEELARGALLVAPADLDTPC